MQCPRCGYQMSPLDTECPRCRQVAQQQQQPQQPWQPAAPYAAPKTNTALIVGLVIGVVVLGCLGVGGVAYMVMRPAFVTAQGKAMSAECLSHMKQMALGVLMFSADHGETLPPAEGWQQAVRPYIRNDTVFTCPGGGGYAFNQNLSGVSLTSISNPAQAIMLYEVEDGEPAFRHDGGRCSVAFVDGHAKLCTKEEFARYIR